MQLLFSSDASACTNALSKRLTDELTEGKQVFLLLSGGSAVTIGVSILSQLEESLTRNLTISLIDERYGNYGHPDSNWQQLLDAGFEPQLARTFPVLQQDNQSLEQTTSIFAANLEVGMADADITIGLFGMGPDGHTSGILPGSPAVKATGLTTSYVTEQYSRITTTFEAIRRCQAVYMFAGGEAKLPALQNLQKSLSLNEQPAQILKELPEAYVYNDQIGDPS